MDYTWNNAKAPDRRVTRYYEMFGSRAIDHEGWIASVPPLQAPGDITLEKPPADIMNGFKWERFILEAERFHAFPLDDSRLPQSTPDRTQSGVRLAVRRSRIRQGRHQYAEVGRQGRGQPSPAAEPAHHAPMVRVHRCRRQFRHAGRRQGPSSTILLHRDDRKLDGQAEAGTVGLAEVNRGSLADQGSGLRLLPDPCRDCGFPGRTPNRRCRHA